MPFARIIHYNFTYVLHNNSQSLFEGPSTHYQNDSSPTTKVLPLSTTCPPLIRKKAEHIENKVFDNSSPLLEFGRDKGGSATITLSNAINSSFDKSWNQRQKVEPWHLTTTAIKETRILCPPKLFVPQTNHLQPWKSWNMQISRLDIAAKSALGEEFWKKKITWTSKSWFPRANRRAPWGPCDTRDPIEVYEGGCASDLTTGVVSGGCVW